MTNMLMYAAFVTLEISIVLCVVLGLLLWHMLVSGKKLALLRCVIAAILAYGVVFIFVGKYYHIL